MNGLAELVQQERTKDGERTHDYNDCRVDTSLSGLTVKEGTLRCAAACFATEFSIGGGFGQGFPQSTDSDCLAVIGRLDPDQKQPTGRPVEMAGWDRVVDG